MADVDGNRTPFSAFNTLLPPNDISEQLVNYLTKVYNSKAIPLSDHLRHHPPNV